MLASLVYSNEEACKITITEIRAKAGFIDVVVRNNHHDIYRLVSSLSLQGSILLWTSKQGCYSFKALCLPAGSFPRHYIHVLYPCHKPSTPGRSRPPEASCWISPCGHPPVKPASWQPADEVRTDSESASSSKFRKLIDRAAVGACDVKEMPLFVYEVRELPNNGSGLCWAARAASKG